MPEITRANLTFCIRKPEVLCIYNHVRLLLKIRMLACNCRERILILSLNSDLPSIYTSESHFSFPPWPTKNLPLHEYSPSNRGDNIYGVDASLMCWEAPGTYVVNSYLQLAEDSIQF